MKKFVVIGLSDAQEPWLEPKALEAIKHGKVFSGGKRHHEIVKDLLPSDAVWIDITVPLSTVFEQYEEYFNNSLRPISSLLGRTCKHDDPRSSGKPQLAICNY